jgi:predicted RNase H-related nuclease YkuK (DUF458 family)
LVQFQQGPPNSQRKEEANLAVQVKLMKTRKRQYPLIHETTFRNTTEQNLEFCDVLDRISRFIASDPRAVYDIVVTTDAQTHSGHTKFVSYIVVYRVGRGAWLCSRQVILPREIYSVQEKLSLETTFSQEIASQFGYAERDRLEDIIFPYVDQGANIRFMVDIDGGTGAKNKTAAYISEMVGRIEAMGLIARVKPESVMVSVADRETKKPFRLRFASS